MLTASESMKSATTQSVCTPHSLGFFPSCASDPEHHARCDYCLELAKKRAEEILGANQPHEIDPLTVPINPQRAACPDPFVMNGPLTASQKYQQEFGGTLRIPAFDYFQPLTSVEDDKAGPSSAISPDLAVLAEKHPRDTELINPGVLNAYEALGRPKKTPSVFDSHQPNNVPNGHATSTTGSVSTEKSNFYFRAPAEKSNYDVPQCCVIC